MPEIARDIFDHMSERIHAGVFVGEASWGHTLPRIARYSQHGHCSTSRCIDDHPERRKHRDGFSAVLTAADEVEVENAVEVLPSRRPPLPRLKFGRASCKLQHREPAMPPHPDATRVASQLRGAGGEKSPALAGRERGAKRQCAVLDEGGASGSAGAGQVHPANQS